MLDACSTTACMLAVRFEKAQHRQANYMYHLTGMPIPDICCKMQVVQGMAYTQTDLLLRDSMSCQVFELMRWYRQLIARQATSADVGSTL